MSNSPCSEKDHGFHVIHEEENVSSATMAASQIITNPDPEKHIVKISEIDLKKITELVNANTLKGYRAGWIDGFDEGSKYNNLFSFSLGVSLGVTVTALIHMVTNK